MVNFVEWRYGVQQDLRAGTDFASRRCIEHFVLGPKMNAVDLAGLDL